MTGLGLILIYGVPLALAAVFWALIRHVFRLWVARDVMESFIPDPQDVAATERELGVG
jgi:hypothetical protein